MAAGPLDPLADHVDGPDQLAALGGVVGQDQVQVQDARPGLAQQAAADLLGAVVPEAGVEAGIAPADGAVPLDVADEVRLGRVGRQGRQADDQGHRRRTGPERTVSFRPLRRLVRHGLRPSPEAKHHVGEAKRLAYRDTGRSQMSKSPGKSRFPRTGPQHQGAAVPRTCHGTFRRSLQIPLHRSQPGEFHRPPGVPDFDGTSFMTIVAFGVSGGRRLGSFRKIASPASHAFSRNRTTGLERIYYARSSIVTTCDF